MYMKKTKNLLVAGFIILAVGIGISGCGKSQSYDKAGNGIIKK